MEMDASNDVFLTKAQSLYDDGYTWEHQFMARAGIVARTLYRWRAGRRIPGPVRAMILAHEKCRKYGVEI